MSTEFEKKLSLTVMANYVNRKIDKGISRDYYLKFLQEKGLIEDIRTITPKGLEIGIEYATNYEGTSRWPVYGENIAKLLISNINEIEAKQNEARKPKPALSPAPVAKKAVTKSTEPSTLFAYDENARFPYLGIDNFVVLDSETSGLNKTTDEIVELAILSMDKEVLYHSTFYPSVEVNPHSSKVNGFTRENLKGSPLFKDEWEKIVAAIGDKKILAHNTPFDRRMMVQTFAKYNIPYDIDKAFEGCYDSQVIAKQRVRSESYSLNHLAHLFGIEEEEKHKATDDCIMLIDTLQRIEYSLKTREILY